MKVKTNSFFQSNRSGRDGPKILYPKYLQLSRETLWGSEVP